MKKSKSYGPRWTTTEQNIEVDEADEVSISSDSATTKSEDAQTLLQVNFEVNSLFANFQKLILSFCGLFLDFNLLP